MIQFINILRGSNNNIWLINFILFFFFIIIIIIIIIR